MSRAQDCPECGKAVTVGGDLGGQMVVCPHCGEAFSAPADGAPLAQAPGVSAGGSLARGHVRFTFSCQRCGSVLESRASLCGQSGRCPTCGAVFTVPQVDVRTGLASGPATVADDGQLPTPLHAYATAGARAPQIRRLDSGEAVIVCPRCGGQMPIEADGCASCGIPFTMEAAASTAASGPERNALATAALTVGVLALLSSCLPVLAPVAIGLGIGGLRYAPNTVPGEGGRKMAMAGIVCGVASLLLGALIHLM